MGVGTGPCVAVLTRPCAVMGNHVGLPQRRKGRGLPPANQRSSETNTEEVILWGRPCVAVLTRHCAMMGNHVGLPQR